MQWDDIDLGGDEDQGTAEELAIDLTVDPVDVRGDGGENVLSADRLLSGQPHTQIVNAVLDDVVDEMVDLLNARDMDGLGELMAPTARATFLSEESGPGVIDGLNDLTWRFPSLLATRGDLGTMPIVALWLFDGDADRFDPLGYLVLGIADDDEALIDSIDYVDEFGGDEELVIESPERTDLSEWDDWTELDYG